VEQELTCFRHVHEKNKEVIPFLVAVGIGSVVIRVSKTSLQLDCKQSHTALFCYRVHKNLLVLESVTQ
jgi:hypothetical protein